MTDPTHTDDDEHALRSGLRADALSPEAMALPASVGSKFTSNMDGVISLRLQVVPPSALRHMPDRVAAKRT